jgi:HlyD family secretion protein
VILLTVGIMAALPLVKVRVVCATAGIIRTRDEAPVLAAPLTGRVLRSALEEFRRVEEGDTLLLYAGQDEKWRIREYGALIEANEKAMAEIRIMTGGGVPTGTSRYARAYRKKEALLESQRVELEELARESRISEALYLQEVIPLRDYEASMSRFRAMEARLQSQEESFLHQLEEEWIRLKGENLRLEGEVESLRSSLELHCLLAPCEGILQHCPAVAAGSLLTAGTPLGHISPKGPLLAECYVGNHHIRYIQTGQECRIRLPGGDHNRDSIMELKIMQVDPDAILVEGRAVYRVRCALESHATLIPGMGFSASIPLYRASLLSLLLREADIRLNPSRLRPGNRHPVK